MHAQRARIAGLPHSRGCSVRRVCARTRVLAVVKREFRPRLPSPYPIDSMPPSAAANTNLLIVATSVATSTGPRKDVDLPSSHPLVQQTAFLGYDDAPAHGEVLLKRLATCQLLRAFGRRCYLAQSIPAALSLSVFNLALTGLAWTRILQELVTSGLLLCSFETISELDDAIDRLTLVNAANLEITQLDLDLGEGTTAVPPAAGHAPVPATENRGRQADTSTTLAASPATGRPALVAELAFLDYPLLPLIALELPGLSPWANVSYLAGALGPCLTQAARNAGGSPRITAGALSAGLNKYLQIPAGMDALLAGELPDFLSGLRSCLPLPMRCISVGLNALRTELRDAILYGQGPDDRARVEARRIHLIGHQCRTGVQTHSQAACRSPAPWLVPRLRLSSLLSPLFLLHGRRGVTLTLGPPW